GGTWAAPGRLTPTTLVSRFCPVASSNTGSEDASMARRTCAAGARAPAADTAACAPGGDGAATGGGVTMMGAPATGATVPGSVRIWALVADSRLANRGLSL